MVSEQRNLCMPTRHSDIQVRIEKDLAVRIDSLRHATQSRTEWINNVLLKKVLIMESAYQRASKEGAPLALPVIEKPRVDQLSNA